MNEERDREMVDAYLAGSTLAQLGERYGITRERVRQIVERSGIEGAAVRSMQARGGYFTPEGFARWTEAFRHNKGRYQEQFVDRNREILGWLSLGWTYEQVAQMCGVSRNTVAGAKWRADRKAYRTTPA